MWGVLGTQSVIAKGKGEPIACWQVKAAVVLTGSEDAAVQYALAHGYTVEQIATARRRCLKG